MKKRFPDPLLRNYELGEKIHPISQELMRMVKYLLSVVYEKEYEETDDDASTEEAEGDDYLFNDDVEEVHGVNEDDHEIPVRDLID
jgi:hypothetical protein